MNVGTICIIRWETAIVGILAAAFPLHQRLFYIRMTMMLMIMAAYISRVWFPLVGIIAREKDKSLKHRILFLYLETWLAGNAKIKQANKHAQSKCRNQTVKPRAAFFPSHCFTS